MWQATPERTASVLQDLVLARLLESAPADCSSDAHTRFPSHPATGMVRTVTLAIIINFPRNLLQICQSGSQSSPWSTISGYYSRYIEPGSGSVSPSEWPAASPDSAFISLPLMDSATAPWCETKRARQMTGFGDEAIDGAGSWIHARDQPPVRLPGRPNGRFRIGLANNSFSRGHPGSNDEHCPGQPDHVSGTGPRGPDCAQQDALAVSRSGRFARGYDRRPFSGQC